MINYIIARNKKKQVLITKSPCASVTIFALFRICFSLMFCDLKMSEIANQIKTIELEEQPVASSSNILEQSHSLRSIVARKKFLGPITKTAKSANNTAKLLRLMLDQLPA